MGRMLPWVLRLRFCALLVCASLLFACGSDSVDGTRDPLLGTWTYSGMVPARVSLAIVLNADESFRFTETVAPWGLPAGAIDEGCITTDTYWGTYAKMGSKTLSWTFTGGIANAVSGCSETNDDSPGRAITLDDISSYREQGLIPAATVTFTTDAGRLTLMPGLGVQASTTFSPAP